MSIHSSILVWPLHRTGQTRGHLWTQTSGCPLLHPDLTACITTSWTRACLDSDEWVSTPPSWSDPCPGLVRPGGISGFRRVGVHSSILVRQLAPLPVG